MTLFPCPNTVTVSNRLCTDLEKILPRWPTGNKLVYLLLLPSPVEGEGEKQLEEQCPDWLSDLGAAALCLFVRLSLPCAASPLRIGERLRAQDFKLFRFQSIHKVFFGQNVKCLRFYRSSIPDLWKPNMRQTFFKTKYHIVYFWLLPLLYRSARLQWHHWEEGKVSL